MAARWFLAATCTLPWVIVGGCESFSASPPIVPDAGGDAAALAPMDGGTAFADAVNHRPLSDAACANPTRIDETFANADMPPGGWMLRHGNTSQPAATNAFSLGSFALLGEVSAQNGKVGASAIEAPLPPGAKTIDLSYSVQLNSIAGDVYVELGCVLELGAHPSPRIRVFFARELDGEMQGHLIVQDVSSTELGPVMRFGQTNEGWFHIAERVTVDATGSVGVAMNMRQQGGWVELKKPEAAVGPSALGRTTVTCGVDYTNTKVLSPVPVQVHVDNISIVTCLTE